MAKVKKLIKPLVIILAVIITGYFMLNIVKNIKAKNHGQLNSYRRSFGGDMIGSYSMTKVKRLGDGTACVIFEESPRHNIDKTVSEYIVSEELLDRISEIADNAKMYTYGDLPDSDFFAYDAGSTGYSLSYENSNVSFSSNKKIPDKGREAIREISKVISEAVADAEKLPGLITEKQTHDSDYMGNRYIADGELYVEVFAYNENVLSYRIKNGTEEETTVKNNITVYKLDGDVKTEIAHKESSYDKSIPSKYSDDSSITIADRLGEGTYLFVIDTLETEFTIG